MYICCVRLHYLKGSKLTLQLWSPPLPISPLNVCSDAERRIAARCWDLAGVQAALRAGSLQVTMSPTAAASMQHELNWTPADLLGYMHCLHPARYRGSEWGLPAGHGGKVAPLAADVYVMGFNRIRGEENQKTVPWVYFKFALRPNVGIVLVLSAHPERN